jgi:hypothetical protein
MDRATVLYFPSCILTLRPKCHIPFQVSRRRSYDNDTSFLNKRKYSKFGFSERLKFSVIRFFFGIQIERPKILFRLYVMTSEINPNL